MSAPTRSGGSGPFWLSSCLVAAAGLVLLAACSGSAGSTSLPPSTTPPPTSTTALAHPTTTAPPSTTTSTTTTQALPSEGEVEAAWEVFWEAWAEVRASNRLDPGTLQQVASGDVVDRAVALFERERESGPDAVETEVAAGATVVDLDTDRASVEDCVLLSPSFTPTTGVHYEAELQLRPRGWVVTELRIPTGAGCVPTEMAEAAIAGYEAYYDALPDFWDPPDPDSPAVDRVLAEPRLSSIVSLLREHEERGVTFRSNPRIHPEVIEVRSPAEVVILDCYEPALADGVYDLSTGEPLPDEPPVRDGQRNLRSAVMVLEDGRWKSSDFQGQVDFACEFAPTDRGLPSI